MGSNGLLLGLIVCLRLSEETENIQNMGNAHTAQKTNKVKVYGYEGRGSKDWVLIDLGEVVLNIMSSSARELYDLESLWDPNL